MPLLTLPLALFALVSLPALVAIYWLRNRLKRQEVSSLHLWMHQREAREGGQRVQKIQIPLLLLLELLALLLLVLAATDPRVLLGHEQRPLVVVLDDSYSMQAGARQQAADELRKTLAGESPLSVRLVLARQTPQTLSTTLTQMSQVDEALQNWTCHSPAADLGSAVALAFELAGPEGRVLVLTDHKPEGTLATQEQEEHRLVWRALGQARPNVAIINAVRSSEAGQDRVLLEVANLSESPVQTQLTIQGSATPLSLNAGEVRRLWLQINDPAAVFKAQLADDALAIDNTVTLLPGIRQPVRLGLSIKHERLAMMLARAAQAQGASIVASSPDLIISDQESSQLSTPETWRVRWLVEEEPAAFIGPFLMDDHHPLTQGLDLQGVVWGAKQVETLPGRTVVAAGNTPLVSVQDRQGLRGSHYDITIRLNPDQSTIGATPAFPVLIWNLLGWRQSTLPGLDQVNVRLGSSTSFIPPRPTDTTVKPEPVQIIAPDGTSHSLAGEGHSMVITTQQAGVYQIVAQGRRFELAANALSPQESDLTKLTSETHGNWVTVSTLRRQYTSIAWMLLLGAMGVLGLHAFLSWRSAGGMR